MSTTATATGTFVWHEQVSQDPGQAKGFYTELFGWETELFKPDEGNYEMISAGGRTHGGFGTAQEGAPPPHWLAHVQVEDVDATIEKAKAAGGSVALGPVEMSEVGRFAIIEDPQGAFISAYSPANEWASPEGVFVWDELGTTDVDAAEKFYGEVFGWTTKDMGTDFGGYRVFSAGDKQVAGMMALQNSSAPPMWVPYMGVDDADATLANATKQGATAIIEAMDVPTVGRIAVIRDPQGAVFGIIKPEPTS
jgi:predicted enzyme related to lactoylglutathione lyase